MTHDEGPTTNYNTPMESQSPAERGLYRWEWAALLLLLPTFAAFGWNVVQRSAYFDMRMTDYGVYTRSAWAVRAGLDPYQIPDDRGWHYCYPPPFVVFMVPLADPPSGADRTGYLPFDINVALWYALNLLLSAWAVHRFALAVMPEAVPWSRRWWYVRLIPFDICITAIGFTLNRGQVNILTLGLLAEMFLASQRRRPVTAGWWLAAAGALKVIPGLLVLYPLLTKQWRGYLGMLAGLALLLGVVPAAVWGVEGGLRMNMAFLKQVVTPGMTNTGDETRSKELMNTTSTDSQAFHAIFHNIRYPNPKERPDNSDGLSKGLHYLLGFSMIGVTVWRARRVPNLVERPAEALLVFGSFCIIMVLLAPASHMHYYAYALPMVMGLVALDLRGRPGAAVPGWKLVAGLAAWTVCISVAMIDSFAWSTRLREVGLGVWPTVALWGYGISRIKTDTDDTDRKAG